MTSYTGHRSPASGSCTCTKEQHDAAVAKRGRPFTDTGMRVKQVDMPSDAPISLIDTYINEKQRGNTI